MQKHGSRNTRGQDRDSFVGGWLSLPSGRTGRFPAIATPRVGPVNRLAAMYRGRIFPERPENGEIGRNVGFLTDKMARIG